MLKIYEVGGSVRDKYLGLKPTDMDYCVDTSLEELEEYIMRIYVAQGGKIVHKTVYGTIRVQSADGKIYDFAICRKDGEYVDGRRPSSIARADILTDLSRRDFTMNAIAICGDEILDPFGGCEDIKKMCIRCIGETREKLFEDPVRFLRALRLSITKKMLLSEEILEIASDEKFINKFFQSVQKNLLLEELRKMFTFDTLASILLISKLPEQFLRICFKDIHLFPKY